MYLTVCPLPWPGFNSQLCRSILRVFPLADHTLPTRPEPAWQKIAQSALNGTTQPVDSEEEGQNSTVARKGLEKNNMRKPKFEGDILMVCNFSLIIRTQYCTSVH